jgi:hypothetical protein
MLMKHGTPSAAPRVLIAGDEEPILFPMRAYFEAVGWVLRPGALHARFQPIVDISNGGTSVHAFTLSSDRERSSWQGPSTNWRAARWSGSRSADRWVRDRSCEDDFMREAAMTIAEGGPRPLSESEFTAFQSLILRQAGIFLSEVKKARSALFRIERSREIPETYLERFMLRRRGPREGTMKAGQQIRDVVRFQNLNLDGETYPGQGSFSRCVGPNVYEQEAA